VRLGQLSWVLSPFDPVFSTQFQLPHSKPSRAETQVYTSYSFRL
ncbi:hypothetical protein Golob_006984, partial [Gossypium lobatum]|nr:hypothetical protein [Gossypium lobatum]MBA0700285.1 hypothetical protein [Gossypium aridum]